MYPLVCYHHAFRAGVSWYSEIRAKRNVRERTLHRLAVAKDAPGNDPSGHWPSVIVEKKFTF